MKISLSKLHKYLEDVSYDDKMQDFNLEKAIDFLIAFDLLNLDKIDLKNEVV